jgi:lipoprotein-anchoring transpeptidase ErfK/SrfK
MWRALERRGHTAVLALLALALLVGASGGPASAATKTKPVAAKPKTLKGPVKGSITLYLPDAYFVNRQPVTVPNRTLHVGGVVRPFVRGQWVTVRTFLGSRLIKSERLRIKRSRNGTYGRFTETLASPGVGNVTVSVTHSRTSTLQGFRGRRSFSALDQNVGFGSAGPFVQLIQQQLAALHFYISHSGVYDQGTGLAIDAYHRLLHWGTYQTLDPATVTYLLNGWGEFKVRYASQRKHAEGDLSTQLLALINGGQVYQIYPISSGKPSTPTILGSFHVYMKDPSYLPDGMYYSNFFTGGYAIHGFNPAPDYPASHGCMRLPIDDAITVYEWLNIGDGVDVYY